MTESTSDKIYSGKPKFDRKAYCRIHRKLEHAWRQKYDLDYRLTALLRTIEHRCNSPKHSSYRWYGAKGIKNLLTLSDIRFLWLRDNAGAMTRPTIDRELSSDNYCVEKCRFIEHAENLRKAHKGK